MNDVPKLTIALITYNCEKFLHQAMSSILMQELDFEYEILCSDDCSTDNTYSILEEYKKNYPNHNIKLLKSEKNLGISKNYQKTLNAATGEYVAILEGDDYWISPTKLAIQVKFLEENKNYSFCFHRYIIHDELEDLTYLSANMLKRKASTQELIYDNFIGNFSTCMYRKSVINNIPSNLYDLKVYDWMFNIINSEYGEIGYLPEVLSIYRKHSNGSWSSLNKKDTKIQLAKSIDSYNKFLNYKYDRDFKNAKVKNTKSGSWYDRLRFVFSIRGVEYITPWVLPPIILYILRHWRLPPAFIHKLKKFIDNYK